MKVLKKNIILILVSSLIIMIIFILLTTLLTNIIGMYDSYLTDSRLKKENNIAAKSTLSHA